jgi:pSer/pThr/pTyr-binding forkhead associated (FHA) protein
MLRLMALILEVIEGPDAGSQVQLEGARHVGRDEGLDLVLADPQVSRRHARLMPDGGGALVEDLGSTNGTFVNGDEIHSPTHVEPGDQLLLGTSVVLVRTPAEVAAQPSAVRPIPPALATPAKPPDYIPASVGKEVPIPELDPLLDRATKAKTRVAPLAIFLLVVLAVIVFLALR